MYTMLHNHTKDFQCGIRSCPPIQNADILPCFLSPYFFYALYSTVYTVLYTRISLQAVKKQSWKLENFLSLPHFSFKQVQESNFYTFLLKKEKNVFNSFFVAFCFCHQFFSSFCYTNSKIVLRLAFEYYL